MSEPEQHPGHEPDSIPPRREPAFNIPAIVMVCAIVCIAAHAARVEVLTPDQDMGVLLRFAFWPVRYTGGFDIDAYAFISPLSYSLLHGDYLHLAVNMVWLAAFGSPLAARTGAVGFVLFWALTALAAVALHFVLHAQDAVPLVGASGAISGMMGAAARFGFQIDRSRKPSAFTGPPLSIGMVLRLRGTVAFLAIWFAINLLMGIGFSIPGVQGQIAWEAHVGGFLAGFFCIGLFPDRTRRRDFSTAANQ